ncbi:hypothetical protein S40293_10991 [Stachybotrys chartarum IBT 40293]|nr:hypothetical protein S40293_10991 [Stachybotrys chartarum IBT 40293]
MHRTSFLQQYIDEFKGPACREDTPHASLNPLSRDTLFLDPLPPTPLPSISWTPFSWNPRGVLLFAELPSTSISVGLRVPSSPKLVQNKLHTKQSRYYLITAVASCTNLTMDPRAQNTAGGAAPPTQENLAQLPRYQNLPTYVATPHYHEKLAATVPTNRNKSRDDMSSYLQQWDTKFNSSSR